MAVASFSVPDYVKEAFDAAFEGQDKDAVMAALMREAVRRERHRSAVERILARHRNAPQVTWEEFQAAREEGRS
ncbi:hypothetical protein [Azohydromonas caseinilytica]|uniref:Antitoxin ParD1/3/4 n=1 Tax=Azohydromonas caseinilytica TaxID=2728836 RepID=A0A848FGJ5_9BURK|nr:hypothetical protein [Azohydromonas caseinilytica]NML18578.1 hypothetical protein [Azohydromonas caseinilytica]